LRGVFARGLKGAWPIVPRLAYQNLAIQSLNVALTRVCNVNCVFCPYQFADKAEKIHMPEDVLARVLDGIQETGIRSVMVAPDLGEPMLVPRFMDKMRAFRRAGVKLIQVTTNATVLHKVGIEELVGPHGPDLINISFPGFDEETYRRVYRSPLYAQTRRNILEILRANHAAGHQKTVTVRMRGDLPEEAMLAFPEVDEVKRLADDVTVMTAVDDWIGVIRQDMLTGNLKIQTERPALTRRPCAVLFNLTVHPDGNLHLCSCRNIFHDPDLEIGNIREMSVLEGWKAIFRVLDAWEDGRIPNICRNCSMYWDPAQAVGGRLLRAVSRKLLGKYFF